MVAIGRDVRNLTSMPRWNARVAWLCLGGLLLFAGFRLARLSEWEGDPTLHSMFESVTIVLALIIGVLAIVRNFTARDVNLYFLGLGFIGAALLDGHHMFVTSEFFVRGVEGSADSNFVHVSSRLFLALVFLCGALGRVYQRNPERRHRMPAPLIVLTVFLLGCISVSIDVLWPPHEKVIGVEWHTFDGAATATAYAVTLAIWLYRGDWRFRLPEFWIVMAVVVQVVANSDFLEPASALFSATFFSVHGFKLISYTCVLIGLMLSIYRRFEQAAASEAKTAFVATISHEIRTPLNAIGGTLGLLDKAQLSQQEKELLSVARESNEVLLGIINNVLDFSKLEAGKVDLVTSECHPAEIVDNVVHLLSNRSYSNRAWLASAIDPRVPEIVRTDDRLVRQVLLNLVGNAIKFSPDGEVAVRAHMTEAGELCFEVADTGIGIPEEQHARVFEDFSRVASRDVSTTSGTGLGLAISRRLVALLGGDIGFTSRAGTGSTFWFTVPCTTVEPLVLQPGAAREFAGLRVLIVGTHPDLWRMLRERLDFNGVETHFEDVAELPEQGVVSLERLGRFDVLLTAWSFVRIGGREMRGREWLNANHRALADRLVLLYSVQSMLRGDVPDMPRADAVLTMPILNRELWRCLEAVTDRKIAHSSRRSWSPDDDPCGDLLRGIHVLLVEDSRANRAVESAMLTALGCRVDEAANGIEAVEAVMKIRYDIVLMDLEMPQMNGYQAARRIRQLDGPASRVPIVAVTAHALSGIDTRCRRAGMDAYVVKPIDRDKLIAAITEFVPRWRVLDTIGDDAESLPAQRRHAG